MGYWVNMMTKISDTLEQLRGKKGSLSDVLIPYLDANGVKYDVAKSEFNERFKQLGGIDPDVEVGSVIIEQDGEKVIFEELTKVCGLSGRHHKKGNVKTDSILNKADRIVLETYRDKKNLKMHIGSEIKDPKYGGYLGGGDLIINMDNALHKKADIPERDETYEIKCKCDKGKLECTGNPWGPW